MALHGGESTCPRARCSQQRRDGRLPRWTAGWLTGCLSLLSCQQGKVDGNRHDAMLANDRPKRESGGREGGRERERERERESFP